MGKICEKYPLEVFPPFPADQSWSSWYVKIVVCVEEMRRGLGLSLILRNLFAVLP